MRLFKIFMINLIQNNKKKYELKKKSKFCFVVMVVDDGLFDGLHYSDNSGISIH